MDKFEISEDDLRFAFNPQSTPRFKMTKAQHTYGVWADEIDQEETFAHSFSSKGARMFSSKSNSGPIGFVSGGVSKPTIKTKRGNNEEISDEDEDLNNDDNDDYEVGKQMSFQQSRPQYTNSKSEIGDWEKHTKGIGQKLLLQMGFQVGKGLGKHGQGRTAPVEAIKRKGKGAIGAYGPEVGALNNDVAGTIGKGDENADATTGDKRSMGGWRKSGYKKKGLNRKSEVDPLLDNRSLQRMKLGDNLSSLPFMADFGSKNMYDNSSTTNDTNKVKVIDMTGKETKILLGYESISQRLNKPDLVATKGFSQTSKTLSTALFDLPELRHNLDVLINQSEKALIKNQQRLSYESQQAQSLREKVENLERTLESEVEEIQRLSKLLIFIERFTNPGETFEDLHQCRIILEEFKKEFRDEYKLYDLKSLISAMVYPMLKKLFADWDPLSDPEYGLETMAEWEAILRDLESNLTNINFDRSSSKGDNTSQLFERALWHLWMPKIRKALQEWDPREYENVLHLVQVWEPVLPSWLLRNLLEQLILPRLQSEVDEWNPLTDIVPIHSWVHPWLPHLDDRLEILYGPIKQKLGNALLNWHPSDASAKHILTPWASIFGAVPFESFLIRTILPKLTTCAQIALTIDPQNQSLDAWKWIIAWEDLLAPSHTAAILQSHMFPKMSRALKNWLSSSASPNYTQISEWYLGWKSLFPKSLLDRAEIKAEFDSLLMIMNQSISNVRSGHSIAAMPPSYLQAPHPRPQYVRRSELPPSVSVTPPPPPSLHSHLGYAPSGADHRFTFKELVQRKLEERGILFVAQAYNPYFPPTLGKQVYKVGGSHCVYIEREVLFLLTVPNGLWNPVSLSDLIKLVEASSDNHHKKY